MPITPSNVTPSTPWVRFNLADGTPTRAFIANDRSVWQADGGGRDPYSRLTLEVHTNGAVDAANMPAHPFDAGNVPPSPSNAASVVIVEGVPYGDEPGCWHF